MAGLRLQHVARRTGVLGVMPRGWVVAVAGNNGFAKNLNHGFNNQILAVAISKLSNVTVSW